MMPSLIISIAALIISVLALYKSWKTQTRQIQIEEARDREQSLQKQKAQLTAKIEKDENKRYWLKIFNKGLSEARDIKVLLDGMPVLKHPTVVRGQINNEIHQVGPETSVRYLLALSMRTPHPSQIDITWSDDSAEPGSYRTTLTI